MGLRTLERGLDIVTLCSESEDGISLEVVMSTLQLPRSSAYRMIGVLRERGFLRSAGKSGRYDLGHKFCEIARLAESRLNFGAIAEPIISALVAEVRETGLLIVRSGWKAICLREVESPQPLRVKLDPGVALPLYAGAAAKIVMAFMSEYEQERILSGDLQNVSRAETLDKAELRQQLKKIRRKRVAISCGEVHPGVVGISVPVFTNKKNLLGGLTIAGPETRIPPARYPEIIEKLKIAAGDISDAYSKAAGLR